MVIDMERVIKNLFIAGTVASALTSLGGCSSSSTPAAVPTTTPTTTATSAPSAINVLGQVFSGNSTEGSFFTARYFHPHSGGRRSRNQVAQTGCPVTVYDVTGATALATGTTDATGTFIVNSGTLTAGTPYKVVAACHSGSYTSIVGADTVAQANKTPTTVDSVSTVESALIIQSVMTAVNSAATANASSASNQAAIIKSVLSPANITQMAGVISQSVENAIATGALPPPSDATATTMASALANVATTGTTTAGTGAGLTGITSVVNTFATSATAGGAIPASIAGTVAGAANAAAAFPGCDSSLPGSSVGACTQAVAELMFNVLGFEVGLLTTGGAFAMESCSATDPVLSAAFTNFTVSTIGSGATELCLISPKVAGVNRNQCTSCGGGGGGGGGGPLFTETDGGVVQTGVLTAMATALYNGLTYHLSDVDSLVFGYSAGTGNGPIGMNMRVLGQVPTTTFSPAPESPSNQSWFITTSYYTLSASGGLTTATQFEDWPTCNGSPCGASQNGGPFGAVTFSNPIDWTTATPQASPSPNPQGINAAALANTLAASTYSGSVFYDVYGGAIPSAINLQNQILNATQGNPNNNRTGNSTFQVLLATQPNWQDPNCQSGTTPKLWAPATAPSAVPVTATTQCLDVNNQPDVPITVNATTGAISDSTQTSLITGLTAPTEGSTGQFYLYPSYANGSFSGIYNFINTQTGLMFTDELMNIRYVQQVMNPAWCGTSTGLSSGQWPAASGGTPCGLGVIYNMVASFSSCGDNCPSVTLASNTPITTDTTTTAAISPTYQPNMSCGNSGCIVGVNVVNGNQLNTVAVVATIAPTTGAITAVCLSTASGCTTTPSHTSNQYFLQAAQVCTGTGCPGPSQVQGGPQAWNPDGYFLVDSSGYAVVSAAPSGSQGWANTNYVVVPSGSLATGLSTFPSTANTCSMTGGCWVNAVRYLDGPGNYLALQGSIFPNSSGTLNSGTFQTECESPLINSGTVANPSFDCSLDPFYLALSPSDTALHSSVNATTGQVTCTNVTFSNSWNLANAINGYTPNCGTGFGESGVTCPAPINPALVMLNNNNAYVYSQPQAAGALMNTAFGSWLDGKHTLTTSTNLNALQSFALVYMLLSGNNNVFTTSSLASTDGISYVVMQSPLFNGQAASELDMINGMNSAIGNSLLTVHH